MNEPCFVEINQKGRRQIGPAQLAGLSAETYRQFLPQPVHFHFSFGYSLMICKHL